MNRSRATRVALLAASSLTALALAAPVAAQGAWSVDSDRLSASEAVRDMVNSAPIATPQIVTNDGPFITPGTGTPIPGSNPPAIIPGSDYANSADVLSTGINGIGQMITIDQVNTTDAFLGLCTGTLINPRTVITAAHCVDSAPAYFYGSNTGGGGGLFGQVAAQLSSTNGIPISFGFSSTNRCRGVAVNGCATGTGPYEAWRDAGFQTVTDLAIYNGNQVWYNPIAPTEFGLADIALVTLDRHVEDIPTWTLLFSPVTESTHATLTGYGGAGVGTSGIGDAAGIDYRRRSAENMLDALMSSVDWLQSPAIFGPDFHDFDALAHSMYWFDFDDPNFSVIGAITNPNFFNNTAPEGQPDNGYYDFNGLGGAALPHEGITAGGDSGGPLIVDELFDRPVVAGVLTGSWSFGGSAYYGEFSVYPPLFLYWQSIVANNPYKYVSAKAGDGDWFDPTHWVQDMDPNYAVIDSNGDLVNSLPDVAQLGHDSTAGRWSSDICFLGFSCSNVTGTAYPTGDGNYIVVPGGPGSTNFVPNNVEPVNSPVPVVYRQARYYDVTLREGGTTTLGGNATIDKLTIDGASIATRLNITTSGRLDVWSDFTQLGGWTNVDGKLTTGEALIASGILSGSGTIDPTYLTVVAGAVAPGGAGIGNLTVAGNVILASASGLLIDLRRGTSDLLKVVGDADNVGALALGDGSLLLTQVPGATAARFGETFLIASAQGGVAGTFGSAGMTSGVLVPHVTYAPDKVYVTLGAASLASLVGGSNSTALAFAGALDALRGTSYNKLWNLYGTVDWMDANQLTTTFSALSPAGIVGETQLMQDRQSRQLFGSVGDRLSLLGTGQARGISFNGGAAPLMRNRDGMSASAQLGLTSTGQAIDLPAAGGLTGFVMTGSDHVRSSYGDMRMGDAGQYNRYFASGLEAPMGQAIVGTAIGYAESTSNAGFDEAKSKVTQAAAYASLPIGGGAYVGGVVAAERASTDVNRLGTDTASTFRLTGATRSSRYMATAEAGFRTGIGHGLSLNPRAQLGVSHYSLGGFREEGGETALALDGLKLNRIESRIGAKLDGTAMLGKWALRPNLQADYVRLLSGANNGLSVSFAAAPEYSFVLPLTNGGSGWMEVKGGVELSRGAFTIGLSGQATAGDAPIADQRGAVDLTLRF
ncbi:MAG TPA: autotransporter domain-containing protein [Sphingomicrobium sp.]